MGPSTEAPGGGADAGAGDWLERFEPVRPLPAGRFARHILCRGRDGGAVVVRELRPEARRRASDRALALAALQHEAEVLTALAATPGAGSFPRLEAAGLGSSVPWIAVEFITGATLRSVFPLGLDGRVPRGQGWTLPRALRAILSLRPGLAALHRLGLAHGALHPGILVVEEEIGADGDGDLRLRLATLGSAGLPSGVSRPPAREALPYLSPRVFQQGGAPGPETDAWSAAAVLHELLTGRAPGDAGRSRRAHEERFAARRLAAAPDPPPGIPAEVVRPFRVAFEAAPSGTGPAEGRPAGEEPLAPFFAALARGLEAAERDAVWRRARLPRPDLEAVRAAIRREAPPPAADLLARHEDLLARLAGASASLLQGFDVLGPLGGGSPWSGWREEVGRQAAEAGRPSTDDPARFDAEALPGRLTELEGRLERLEAIAVQAVEILRPPLERLQRETEGDPGAAELSARLRARLEATPGAEARPSQRFAAAARLLADGAAAGEDRRRRSEAWRRVAEPAEQLLRAPRTAESLRAMTTLAGEIQTAAPAGFEEPARDLARRLASAVEAPRAAARDAVEAARRFARERAAAAEIAAERALAEGLADRNGAAAFCAALERLEKEAEAAAGRLRGGADPEALPAIAAHLEGLQARVAEARRSWWPADRLPLSGREWTDLQGRVRTLAARGGRSVRQARALMEPLPAGWEEAGRRLLESLPVESGPAPRRWLVPAGAGALAVAAVAVWLMLPRSAPAPPPAGTGAAPAPAGGTTAGSAAAGNGAEAGRNGAEAARNQAEASGNGAAAAGGAAASQVWIHAPALVGLAIVLEQDGRAATPIPLPGMAAFRAGAPLRVRLTWGDGSSKEGEVAAASAAAIQAKVDDLVSGASPDPGRSERLDGVVAGWADGILGEGR